MSGDFFKVIDILQEARMPCSISDGPQTPDEVAQPEIPDEDSEYERERRNNELNETLRDIARTRL